MNKIIAITLTALLTACASTPKTAPTTQLGTVVEKQTFINQSKAYRSPVDVGFGLGGGGGHMGWGINLGLNTLFNLAQGNSTESAYQYKIKVGNNESLTMQSKQDFAVGSCLTVLTLAGDSDYPKISANPDCK